MSRAPLVLRTPPPVNAALVEYLEAAALEAYRRWDADADAEERAALEALTAHDHQSAE